MTYGSARPVRLHRDQPVKFLPEPVGVLQYAPVPPGRSDRLKDAELHGARAVAGLAATAATAAAQPPVQAGVLKGSDAELHRGFVTSLDVRVHIGRRAAA